MDKTITLLMGIHCHQPVGNFGWVFEEAYEKSYKPFLDVLEKHPKIKIALHYSGCLLDWFMEKKPEFIVRLKKLVNQSQIELMTAGYYEPIIPIIPKDDAIGQVAMLTDFLKKRLSYDPKGLWLTERVWEKSLIKFLSEIGVRYTIVDDYHFELAGLDVNNLSGYYTAVDGKNKINLFPSSKKLRYIMPFSKAHEVIDYLRSKATPDGGAALTFGDDGEKFGLWPHTYDWVYNKYWLENFLTLLEENSSWIKVKTFSEFIDESKSSGTVDIPTASYAEMMEWSKGNFRNFFTKYPESSDMRNTMFYVSSKVNTLSAKKDKLNKPDLKVLDEAKRELYKGQCNCAYWHGIFGGLYLGYLRSSIYEKLINSGKLIDKIEHHKEKRWVSLNEADINKDGFEEIVLSNPKVNLFINPKRGGVIYELDYKEKSLNLLNTLSRRPESYHEKLVNKNSALSASYAGKAPRTIHDNIAPKEENLEEILFYDKYRKAALIDHFFKKTELINNFINSSLNELGDFVEGAYLYRTSGRDLKEVTLVRRGFVGQGESKSEAEITKKIVISSGSSEIEIDYRIKNTGKAFIESRFGIETNLFLKDKNYSGAKVIESKRVLDIHDDWTGTKLSFRFDKDTDIWTYELETVSDSESGLERTYQELSLMFINDIKLEPKKEFNLKIKGIIS